jgi:hypothetical protein
MATPEYGRQAAVVWILVIDSKPLPVGAYSKDRNARRGWIARGKWARGYKLHLIWSDAAEPEMRIRQPMSQRPKPIVPSLG